MAAGQGCLETTHLVAWHVTTGELTRVSTTRASQSAATLNLGMLD